jgi:hypothetical protein
MKLLLRSWDLIAEPGKNVDVKDESSVFRKIRIDEPRLGALVNCIVVGLARVNPVTKTPSTLVWMSVEAKYGKVKEKRTVAPSPVYVF